MGGRQSNSDVLPSVNIITKFKKNKAFKTEGRTGRSPDVSASLRAAAWAANSAVTVGRHTVAGASG